jgi:hypothetical protein
MIINRPDQILIDIGKESDVRTMRCRCSRARKGYRTTWKTVKLFQSSLRPDKRSANRNRSTPYAESLIRSIVVDSESLTLWRAVVRKLTDCVFQGFFLERNVDDVRCFVLLTIRYSLFTAHNLNQTNDLQFILDK